MPVKLEKASSVRLVRPMVDSRGVYHEKGVAIIAAGETLPHDATVLVEDVGAASEPMTEEQQEGLDI